MTAQAGFPALGGAGVVITTDGHFLEAAMAAVAEVVDEFDRACSRFRDDSELTAVNRAGGGRVRVGAVLLDALAAAVRAAELTGGDVAPTLGAQLVALGYDRDFDLGLDGRGTSGGEPPGVRVTLEPAWRAIRVDAGAGTVSVPAGVGLDLGATAKALAADRAAVRASRATDGAGVLVGLAGDVATAGVPPGGGWRIRVTDDHRAWAAPGQWISIQAGGVATSSTTTRRWRTASGEQAHHLLDPHSGRPLRSPWRTASVAAATCLDANIAATAALVRGAAAADWLEGTGLPARLVDLNGRVVHLAGWPAAGEELECRVAARA